MFRKFYCEKCNFNTHKKYNFDKHCKSKKHINKINKYKKGKIYIIRSNYTDNIYIGCTCKDDITLRLLEHEKDYKKYQKGKRCYISSFKILQYPNYYIELIENYPCYNRKELLLRETFYIKNTKNCINKISVNYEKSFTCEYCNKCFAKTNKSRHNNRCKLKKKSEVDEKIKKLEILTIKLKEKILEKDNEIDDIYYTLNFMKSMVTVESNTTTITNNINNNTNV
jgi:hypothetical protein